MLRAATALYDSSGCWWSLLATTAMALTLLQPVQAVCGMRGAPEANGVAALCRGDAGQLQAVGWDIPQHFVHLGPTYNTGQVSSEVGLNGPSAVMLLLLLAGSCWLKAAAATAAWDSDQAASCKLLLPAA